MAEKQQDKSPEATSAIFNIVGEKVALGPMRKDLVPHLNRLYNDLRTLSRLGNIPLPWTLEQDERRYEWVTARKETEVVFLIYEQSSGCPIGITGLGEVDKRNRTADFGISIGEPKARGKGYGTETTQLVLDYAFTGLGLHNVLLSVFEYNLPAIRAYTKAGFKEFGRRRESIFMGGKLWDNIFMECLSTVWGPSPVLAKILKPDDSRPSP